MKIVLAQTHIIWENKLENIISAKRIVANCATNSVDVVLFPEMSFTGFSMNTDVTSEDDEFTIGKMSEIAIKNGVVIGFGWVNRTGAKCKNMYTLVNKDGSVISSYAKIHPFSYSREDEKFAGGEKVVIYEIDGIPFSHFICYDLRFPEVFRTVADRVHAIIVPACWPAKRSEHWKALLRARAIENQVYIYAINCQGDIGGLYYSGDSCVISPDGHVLEILSDKEGIIKYDFIDDVKSYRNGFPILKDRRSDLYRYL